MYNVYPITSTKPLDCGSTCLKMLLAYYGIDIPLETLTKECGITVAGCTMGDLKRVGNAHGLDMHAYSTDIDGVLKADRPSICWWKYNHFIICCGLDDDGKVVICNPDKGRYRISQGLFKAFYSNKALFNGEPQDLPEEPSDQVTLTQSEYDDIMDVVAKAEEVFANEAGE